MKKDKTNKKKKKVSRTFSIWITIILCVLVCLVVILYMLPSKIEIYGKKYRINSEIVDLTDIDVIDADKLISEIPYFNRLKTVKLADGAISFEELNRLKSRYPMIEFSGGTYADFYGLRVDTNCKSINLGDVPIDDKFLYKVGIFPHLEEIILYNSDLSEDDVSTFNKYYPRIKLVFKVSIADLTVDSNIENLDLSKHIITDKVAFKEALSRLKDLKTLDMSYTNFSNEELGSLREEFPNVTIDWVLFLSKWSFRTDVVSFSVLVRRFDYKRITSDELEVFKYTKNIQTLDLGHQNITDVSAIAEYLPNLKLLILADNKISDITPLGKLEKLTYIELFLNKITDISPLANCKELRDVNICYNPRLKDITPLHELPNLERVWLVNLPISQKQISDLQKAYPNTQISLFGDGSTDGGWRTHPKYYEMIKMFKNRYYKSEKYFNIE